MKFPSVSDIATKNVVSIDILASVHDALEKMVVHEHRNIVVCDGVQFYTFTVLDIVKMKANHVDFNTLLKHVGLKKIPIIDKDKNVLETLEYLNKPVEYICVVNKDKSLHGLITHSDITSNIDPDTLMDNFHLEDFLKLGRRVKWVSKDKKTIDLLEKMMRGHFDNLIIVEDKKPIGILTTKDIMNLIKNNSDFNLSVSHYMSSPVETIPKSATVKEALTFLKTKHYKRVVVVDEKDGTLSGIITQKELISLTYSRWSMLMKEYQSELSELNSMLESKNKEYEILASTDSLTGLYNRHKFSELYLSTYTSMTQRSGDLSIIMLDIDFFKRVNDTYGHNVGDRVLVQVAHLLLKTLRNIDIVCRWGGEEFVCLLPTVSLAQALLLGKKIQENFVNLECDIVDNVTASFGIAQVQEGEEMESVIERADKALYLAKKSGRDCVKSELDI